VNIIPNFSKNQKQRQKDSAANALLNSLKDSNASPKMKTSEEKIIKVVS
jgi:hypothetical protein